MITEANYTHSAYWTGYKKGGRIMNVNKILQLGDETSQSLKYISSLKLLYKSPGSESTGALVNPKPQPSAASEANHPLGWYHSLH